jgi:fumarylacetoacetase
MNDTLDSTNDAGLVSWLESANDPATDFPIQNLPFGRFRRDAGSRWSIGVAIGDQVLDLEPTGLVRNADMHDLMALERAERAAL